MLSYTFDFQDDKLTSGKFFIIIRFEFRTRHQWTCCEEKVLILVSPSAIWAPPIHPVRLRLMFPWNAFSCVSVTPGAAPTNQPTDRQTDRQTTRRSSPQIQLMWCARQSAAHWLLRRPQSLARNSHLLSRLSSWKYYTGNASLKLFQYKGLCSEWRLGANVWNTKVNFRKLFWKVTNCAFFSTIVYFCVVLLRWNIRKNILQILSSIVFKSQQNLTATK